MTLETAADLASTAATVVAVLTLAWNIWSDRKQRESELHNEAKRPGRQRRGVLRLFRQEVLLNDRLLRIYETRHDAIVERGSAGNELSTRIWEDARILLSELLESDTEFADMLLYYNEMHRFTMKCTG